METPKKPVPAEHYQRLLNAPRASRMKPRSLFKENGDTTPKCRSPVGERMPQMEPMEVEEDSKMDKKPSTTPEAEPRKIQKRRSLPTKFVEKFFKAPTRNTPYPKKPTRRSLPLIAAKVTHFIYSNPSELIFLQNSFARRSLDVSG